MVPLITLLIGSAAARIAGWFGLDYTDSWPKATAVGLAAMFVMTGVAHFVQPLRNDMVAIVPPQLPSPAVLVTVTGVLELLGAVGLLLPHTRVAAAWCLLVLMLAMFPANIYAARMPNPPKSMSSDLSVRSAEEVIYLAAAVMIGIGGS